MYYAALLIALLSLPASAYPISVDWLTVGDGLLTGSGSLDWLDLTQTIPADFRSLTDAEVASAFPTFRHATHDELIALAIDAGMVDPFDTYRTRRTGSPRLRCSVSSVKRSGSQVDPMCHGDCSILAVRRCSTAHDGMGCAAGLATSRARSRTTRRSASPIRATGSCGRWQPVPEGGTAALFVTGLLSLAGWHRARLTDLVDTPSVQVAPRPQPDLGDDVVDGLPADLRPLGLGAG